MIFTLKQFQKLLCYGVLGLFISCAGFFEKRQEIVVVEAENEVICKEWNRSYGDRSSAVCENADTYDFKIAGNIYSFAKRNYQQTLRMKVGNWLVKNQYSMDLIRQAKVEVWAGSGVFNPKEPLLRVQIIAPKGNMIFKLPFYPSEWKTAKVEGALLGGHVYPNVAGYKAGELILTLTPHSTKSDLSWLLEMTPDAAPKYEEVRFPTFRLLVRPLTEVAVRNELHRRAKSAKVLQNQERYHSILQRIKLSPAMEVAGEFVKAFEFSLIPEQQTH